MRAFGTKDIPFETEKEARDLLRGQGLIQIEVPHGRRFMHSTFVNDKPVYEIMEVDGVWVVEKTDESD